MKVGVILPLGDRDELGRPFMYPQIREFALHAEAVGLNSVWIYDHLFYDFPNQGPSGVLEGWTIWTALADATERVELGALVLCTAFRNPAVTAKMAVTLDEVSGGRIILGLGAGWHQPEFDAFGLKFDHRVDQFEEALEIIVPLVKKGEVDFNGHYSSAPKCQLLPRPARDIPILVASVKPRMLKLTAKFADSWNTAWHGEVSATKERRAALNEACAAVGRDPSTLAVTAGVNVGFPDLGDVPDFDATKMLSGSVDDVAAGLRGYAEAEVSHVIASLYPLTKDSIGQLAEAAKAAMALAPR
jgi:alkanesulfonate monooxygenase SsuD/methylene tetrahydromethanopterin reductase-like flavin-dependent oxidoreductase (luciferase family)